jgi:uncharacterized protein with PQ loop repeat
MEHWIEKIGTLSAIALPFFNIPLIWRLWQRKSSKEYSMTWTVGVWACIVLMTPQAMRSQDVAFRSFGLINAIFFTVVAFLIVKYRQK